MKTKIYLTESDLHNLIRNVIVKIIKESHEDDYELDDYDPILPPDDDEFYGPTLKDDEDAYVDDWYKWNEADNRDEWSDGYGVDVDQLI